MLLLSRKWKIKAKNRDLLKIKNPVKSIPESTLYTGWRQKNKAMKREIEFRAKRVDNGKFVFGYLIRGKAGEELLSAILPFGDFVEDIIEVDYSTLGQYTGEKDKFGHKIYDDDILVVPYNNIGYIRVSFYDGKYNFSKYLISKLVKVGNFFDNPELLKK